MPPTTSPYRIPSRIAPIMFPSLRAVARIPPKAQRRRHEYAPQGFFPNAAMCSPEVRGDPGHEERRGSRPVQAAVGRRHPARRVVTADGGVHGHRVLRAVAVRVRGRAGVREDARTARGPGRWPPIPLASPMPTSRDCACMLSFCPTSCASAARRSRVCWMRWLGATCDPIAGRQRACQSAQVTWRCSSQSARLKYPSSERPRVHRRLSAPSSAEGPVPTRPAP